MVFTLRCAMSLVALIFVLQSASGVQAKERGIPKSAPAFTKFVARFIQDAMPSARVSVISRLRLDVETPSGGHTTDLHNLYSLCQRDPDDCDPQVTTFVGQMVEVYASGDVHISRDLLRVVVRPSAFVAEIHANPKRNKPIAEPLAGDYWLITVIDQKTSLAVMDENDLPTLKLSVKDALNVAKSNTRRALQHSVEQELAKGSRRGILGGDVYTSSAFAFPDLFAAAAHACKDNFLVSVPATDVVIYADGREPGAAPSMKQVADDVMAHELKPFSDAIFRWTPHGWETARLPVGGNR